MRPPIFTPGTDETIGFWGGFFIGVASLMCLLAIWFLVVPHLRSCWQ